MNKADRFKLLYIFGISLMFYFIGCVDTSVQNIPTSFDYQSQLQLVNLASVSGTATIDIVNVDGSVAASTQLSVGSAYPADPQPFMDIPSGTKTFKVTFSNASFNNEFKYTIDSERKIRLFLINPDSSSTNLIKTDERYTWQTKNSDNAGNLYPAGSASIAFFNASPTTTIDILLAQDSTLTPSLAVGKALPYMTFKAGNITVTFKKDTTGVGGNPTLASATIDAKSQGRYSAVLYGTTGNLQAKVYTDD
ncbi:MAG: DUF4397 domain-containing protein [Ignavibacteriaceae bacterium]